MIQKILDDVLPHFMGKDKASRGEKHVVSMKVCTFTLNIPQTAG